MTVGQKHGDIFRNAFFQFPCLCVQGFQFFVQFLQAFSELEVVSRPFRYADVSTGIQAPALPFNFGKRGDFAQSKDIGVLALRKV